MNVVKPIICCIAVLLLNSVCQAESGFELPLKELKKPSLPSSARKQKPAAPKETAKPATEPAKIVKPDAETVRKKAAAKPPESKKSTMPVKAASSASAEGFAPVEDLILKPGLPCWFAGQTAGAIAISAPELLDKEYNLAPVAVVRYDDATTVVTCGMPLAEQFTLARLMERQNIQLVNINGSETAEQVIVKIVNSLGFSYQTEHAEETQILLIAASAKQEKLIRLTIKRP